MSEHTPSPEHHERIEPVHTPELEPLESPEHNAKSSERGQNEQIKAIQERVEQQAVSGKEVTVGENEQKTNKQHFLVNKELRVEAFHRSLNRIRKHLSPANKGLSKAIHLPVVDALSKLGEKTVARPIGLLAGSIVALIGSSYVFYSAKHYGYTYNYLVVFILFAGGYLVGLIIELLVYTFRRRGAK